MIRNAPPLVLLPAMGCDGQLWARQIVDLSDITHPMLGDLSVDDTLEAMAARVLFALASVVAETDLDEGGKLLQRSLEIRRAALGPEHPDTRAAFALQGAG